MTWILTQGNILTIIEFLSTVLWCRWCCCCCGCLYSISIWVVATRLFILEKNIIIIITTVNVDFAWVVRFANLLFTFSFGYFAMLLLLLLCTPTSSCVPYINRCHYLVTHTLANTLFLAMSHCRRYYIFSHSIYAFLVNFHISSPRSLSLYLASNRLSLSSVSKPRYSCLKRLFALRIVYSIWFIFVMQPVFKSHSFWMQLPNSNISAEKMKVAWALFSIFRVHLIRAIFFFLVFHKK